MKVFDKLTFFEELNLENLSREKKDKIWGKFVELVSLEVLDKILAELPEKDQERLFLNLAKNRQKVEKFLAENKRLKPIFDSAMLKIKKQILVKFVKK